MGNGITPLSQILYDLFFDMSLVKHRMGNQNKGVIIMVRGMQMPTCLQPIQSQLFCKENSKG
jgi:hypothetical protein